MSIWLDRHHLRDKWVAPINVSDEFAHIKNWWVIHQQKRPLLFVSIVLGCFFCDIFTNPNSITDRVSTPSGKFHTAIRTPCTDCETCYSYGATLATSAAAVNVAEPMLTVTRAGSLHQYKRSILLSWLLDALIVAQFKLVEVSKRVHISCSWSLMWSCEMDSPYSYVYDLAARSQHRLSCVAAPKVCESSPCHHGGTCYSDNHGNYTCQCPDDWTGLNCDIREFRSHFSYKRLVNLVNLISQIERNTMLQPTNTFV